MASYEIEVIESVQRFYTYEADSEEAALAQFNNGDEPVTPAYDASVLDYDVRAINGKEVESIGAPHTLSHPKTRRQTALA